GNNWILKLDTTGGWSTQIAFFDSLEGIITAGKHFYRTSDGGDTWTMGSLFLTGATGISSISIYSDSLICIGEVGGNFYLSKDRGVTWPIVWGLGQEVVSFEFLNSDTIFALSAFGGISKTTNGGTNW